MNVERRSALQQSAWKTRFERRKLLCENLFSVYFFFFCHYVVKVIVIALLGREMTQM
jgi:hypothetical protein